MDLKAFLAAQGTNPKFLRDGDVIETAIGTDDGTLYLGRQRNTVRDARWSVATTALAGAVAVFFTGWGRPRSGPSPPCASGPPTSACRTVGHRERNSSFHIDLQEMICTYVRYAEHCRTFEIGRKPSIESA